MDLRKPAWLLNVSCSVLCLVSCLAVGSQRQQGRVLSNPTENKNEKKGAHLDVKAIKTTKGAAQFIKVSSGAVNYIALKPQYVPQTPATSNQALTSRLRHIRKHFPLHIMCSFQFQTQLGWLNCSGMLPLLIVFLSQLVAFPGLPLHAGRGLPFLFVVRRPHFTPVRAQHGATRSLKRLVHSPKEAKYVQYRENLRLERD